MAPDRRARSTVAGAVPVVEACPRARGQGRGRNRFRQSRRIRWNVIEHPVDPGHLRRCRVRRIGIIDDQRQALGAFRHPRPRQRGRDIIAVARILLWDFAVVSECRGCDCQRHRSTSFGRLSPWHRSRAGQTQADQHADHRPLHCGGSGCKRCCSHRHRNPLQVV